MLIRGAVTSFEKEQVLILAKTYPTPSKGHVETTCVAAVNRSGQLRRIFPVPFRLLRDDQQFTKWQWVNGDFRMPSKDHRPESRRIDVLTMSVGERMELKRGKGWEERITWILPHIVPCYKALEQRRQETGETLGFLRPSRVVGLDITPLPIAEQDWDESEKAKLTGDLETADLFTAMGESGRQRRARLQKLPFHVHYRYEIDTPEGIESNRHLVTDWEVGALYRNCSQSYGLKWEEPFRAKLEAWMQRQSPIFMMGTQHRFPDQWLIISFFTPQLPVEKTSSMQGSLFE